MIPDTFILTMLINAAIIAMLLIYFGNLF